MSINSKKLDFLYTFAILPSIIKKRTGKITPNGVILEKQAQNIIIDLSYSQMPEDLAIKEVTRHFFQSKACKRLKIITKTHNLLEYKK